MPSINEDFLRTPVEFEPRRKDNLFLWTVFLLLLVGFSMACWVGSYLLFSRPETPLSYKILRKIKKIDLPERFTVQKPPPGEFMPPEKAFNRYNALTKPALRDLNLQLERNYLRNYPVSNELVPYITGRFTIMASYELGPADFVTSGVATLAVASDYPKLLIEHLYCAGPAVAPIIKRNLRTGMDIELRRTYELTAVLHVAKLDDGHILLTVVPLNYGSYVFKGVDGGFGLEPPTALNVAAGWPVIRGARYLEADQAYVTYRTGAGLGPFGAGRRDTDKPPDTALKGVDLPVAVESPAPSASPPAQIAKADPPGIKPANPASLASPGKKPSATPAATPALVAKADIPVARALPVNEPARNTPSPPPVVKAAAPVGGQGGVSLQPFLQAPSAADNAPGTAAAGTRTWQTYTPGRQPGGKNISVADVASFNKKGGLNGDTVYLSGQFTVRALGENKTRGIKNAVLRSNADANVRVIVEYPSDRPLPAQGTDINRDEERPYQITDMRVTPDGTLNVYAREIIN